jgi:DNA ligase D-like protein (predicted 3'-phosphoesterase)
MTKSKFIVVEHHAIKARLHFDLRFKMPDSENWISFAVRKGVPLSSGIKVLAVRTHDHSEEEALFLGKIESGYGAGELKKWDEGECDIIKFGTGHLTVDFHGTKVKGIYHFVNTGVIDREYKKQQYILFKGKETVKENFWNDSEGLNGRVPPNCTQDLQLGDEEADEQQKKPLKWAVGRSSIKDDAEWRDNVEKARQQLPWSNADPKKGTDIDDLLKKMNLKWSIAEWIEILDH